MSPGLTCPYLSLSLSLFFSVFSQLSSFSLSQDMSGPLGPKPPGEPPPVRVTQAWKEPVWVDPSKEPRCKTCRLGLHVYVKNPDKVECRLWRCGGCDIHFCHQHRSLHKCKNPLVEKPVPQLKPSAAYVPQQEQERAPLRWKRDRPTEDPPPWTSHHYVREQEQRWAQQQEQVWGRPTTWGAPQQVVQGTTSSFSSSSSSWNRQDSWSGQDGTQQKWNNPNVDPKDWKRGYQWDSDYWTEKNHEYNERHKYADQKKGWQ